MKKVFIVVVLMTVLASSVIEAQSQEPIMMVYIGGSYQEKPFGTSRKACYWVNGSMKQVEGVSVDAITTYKGRVYSAGVYREQGDTKICCYWKEEMPYALPDCKFVKKILVNNDNVYVSGNFGDNNETCYWINGIRHSGPTDGYMTDFTVVKDVVYSVGAYKTGDTFYACYWIGGVRHELTNSQNFIANDIEVVEGKIYVGAWGTMPSNRYGTCYWINGVQTVISDAREIVNEAFIVFNGNVYMMGKEHYWINGVRRNYKAAGFEGSVYTFARDKVYIAGAYSGLGGNDACYWIDAERHNLYGLRDVSGNYFNMKSIYVTELMLPE